MTNLKKEHFVQFEGMVHTIVVIKDGIARLCNGQDVDYDLLAPIEIGGPFDKRFTLVNDLIRFPCGVVKNEPVKPYIDCYVSQEMTISDVLKENPSIRFIHELQDWLLTNTKGCRLARII